MKRSIVTLAALFITASAFAQGGEWHSYSRSNSGLQGDSITSIAFDNSNNIWIGCFPGGLAKFDGSHWTTFNDFTSVPSNDINALCYLNGILWVATSEGLTKYNGSAWHTYTIENSQLADNTVNCLAADPDGNLWIGTSSGLSELKADGSWSTFDESNIPIWPDQHIYAVTVARTGSSSEVWVAFGSAYGMSHFNPSNLASAKLVNQDSIPEFPADHIGSIVQDWAGSIWASSEYYGIVKVNGSTATHFYSGTDATWINDKAHAVAIDRCGHVWTGTEGGAAKLDASVWSKYTTSISPLTNDYIQTIAVDAAGHIWFGTHRGVTEFKPLPEKPVLISPANLAIVATDVATCTWNWDCPGILKYWFEIADNAEFNNSTIDTTSASLMQAANHLDSNFVNRTTYYWRIKAKNDAGWGPMSAAWSFTYIMPVPQRPTLLSPADGATVRSDSVTCYWAVATPHVQKYWYELSADPQFLHSIVDTVTSIDANSTGHWNTNLIDGKTYYWRVKAENLEGWGAASDTWSFKVNKSSGVDRHPMMAAGCTLYQNFPNPCTDRTSVQFSMTKHEHVSLQIYDGLGSACATILDGDMGPGSYNVQIDRSMLPDNGMYFYCLTTHGEKHQRMMQILR